MEKLKRISSTGKFDQNLAIALNIQYKRLSAIDCHSHLVFYTFKLVKAFLTEDKEMSNEIYNIQGVLVK